MSSNKTISDIIDFNPKRPIKKGEVKPFIEMSALPVDNRDVSEFGERELKGGGSKFKNGDTLFARITPCLENGKTAKVNCLNQDEHGHGSTEFIVMSAKAPEYDVDYVYYLARHPEFRAYAQSRMEGTSGRQRVAWQSLAEFEFDYPDKDIRKEAGKFLKEIDDKIALNTQTNQTLEQIAQALFKSWFVDFDPVKAKIATLESGGSVEDAELTAMSVISSKSLDELVELKQVKPEDYKKVLMSLLAQTAALFPSAMQESELGEMPERWTTSQIKNVAATIKGKSYKSTELKGSTTALVTLKSFKRGGGYRLDGLKEYTGKYKPEQEVFAGDLIIAYTDVTQAADVIGKPAMVASDARYQHLVISLDVAVVRPENDTLKHYLYGIAQTDIFQQHTNAHSTGTTVLHLSKKATGTDQ